MTSHRRTVTAVVVAGCLATGFHVTGAQVAPAWAAGAAGAAPAPAAGTALAPAHLTIGDRTTPLDVTGAPQFGWLPRDRAGDQTETGYELTVRDALTGAPVWDSGRVASSASSYVPYGGPALAAGAAYDWSVTTWNRQGQRSPAATSSFGTGLGDGDWSGAQWIRRPTTGHDSVIDYTLARRQFGLAGRPVVRAVAYLAAPMRWQLHVNGTVVNTQDDYQFAGENYYDAVDITRQARAAQRAPGRPRTS